MNGVLSQVGIRQFVGQFYTSSWKVLIKYVGLVQVRGNNIFIPISDP